MEEPESIDVNIVVGPIRNDLPVRNPVKDPANFLFYIEDKINYSKDFNTTEYLALLQPLRVTGNELLKIVEYIKSIGVDPHFTTCIEKSECKELYGEKSSYTGKESPLSYEDIRKLKETLHSGAESWYPPYRNDSRIDGIENYKKKCG